MLLDQVNPAVTLSLLATRRLDVLRASVYITAQCLGASLGAGALYLALPLKTTADHFVNRVSSQIIIIIVTLWLLSEYSCLLTCFSFFLFRHSGSYRVECRPGSGHRGFVHLPDGLHGVLSGGPTTEGKHRTRKPGYRISTHCWSANRRKRSFLFSFVVTSSLIWFPFFFFFFTTKPAAGLILPLTALLKHYSAAMMAVLKKKYEEATIQTKNKKRFL